MTTQATDTPPETERRTLKRARVDMLLNRFVNGDPCLCHATDISVSGMRLHTIGQQIPQGPSYMGLQFELPGTGKVITASGQVAFTDRHRGTLGVRFTNIAPQHAALIASFLATG